jgi:hypothetical protein
VSEIFTFVKLITSAIMNRIFKIATLLLLGSLTLSSCGVMFGGSKYIGTINVKNHPNAQIYVDGTKVGQGTGTVVRPRNLPLTVEVKQEGCEPKTQVYHKAFRTGNFILSAAMWGIIGIAVDLGTGASFKPDHKGNPAIQKLSDKEYSFTVDYSGCPNNN